MSFSITILLVCETYGDGTVTIVDDGGGATGVDDLGGVGVGVGVG